MIDITLPSLLVQRTVMYKNEEYYTPYAVTVTIAIRYMIMNMEAITTKGDIERLPV